jgi:hypothetical protein
VAGLGPGLPPMACKIRIEYAGAAYHVMARGNQGRDIYADERGRKLRLATLGEACEKTGWRIHARLKSDAGHWPVGGERAAGTGAAEEATRAGL